MSQTLRKVDVHCHVIPEVYTQALETAGSDNHGFSVQWSPQIAIEQMDSLGISTAMLSVTMPGARVFQGSNARALARQMNENIASVCGENPDRFGFFVNLPDVLLDTAGALEEIRYGLDVLKADGVILFTRYGDGNTYLGNPNIEAIWEELNKHNAVVLVHPSNATEKVVVNPRLPHLLIEGPHETTRAAMDMIVSGTVRKFPDCKIVLCHAGGTLPWVIGRVLDGLDLFGILDPHQALQDFGRFYFELALSTKPSVVAMLRSLVSDQQILYGSDYPYNPLKFCIKSSDELEEQVIHDAEFREKIYRLNALRLFPRLYN